MALAPGAPPGCAFGLVLQYSNLPRDVCVTSANAFYASARGAVLCVLFRVQAYFPSRFKSTSQHIFAFLNNLCFVLPLVLPLW
jgi:hypothetical protein